MCSTYCVFMFYVYCMHLHTTLVKLENLVFKGQQCIEFTVLNRKMNMICLQTLRKHA